MTLSALHPSRHDALRRITAVNPHLPKEVGVYVEVFEGLNDNEIRFIMKRLPHYKHRVDKTFKDYCAGLVDYSRNHKVVQTDGLYNVNYIACVRNITHEQAVAHVESLKANKATSLAKFIERHGLEKGTRLFAKFKETSEWRTNYAKVNGVDSLLVKNQTVSKRSKMFWTKRGYSEEEAIELVSIHQRNNSGVHREFHIRKGRVDAEIDVIFTKMNRLKDNRTTTKIVYIETYGYELGLSVYKNYTKFTNDGASPEYFKRRYGDDWEAKYIERYDNVSRKTKRRPFHSEKASWRKYKHDCKSLTTLTIKLYPEKIKNIELRSTQHHVDHVFSIYHGYRNNIDPAIIAHHSNLRVICSKDNLKKGVNSHKTIVELLNDYSQSESTKCV